MAGSRVKALTLLALLLCLEEAWALKCYNCTNLNGNSCQKEIVCPATSKACYSETLNIRNGDVQLTATNKFCAVSCDNIVPAKSRETLIEAQVSFYCCNTDLCNGAGAQGPGATTVSLMLVASVLSTLLGTSV